MNFLEIFAMVFTLICVYLTSKQSIWCWPTGILSIIAFFLLYLDQKIYFQTSLQVIFFFQSLYAWYKWSSKTNSEENKVKNLTKSEFYIGIGVVFMLSGLILNIMYEKSTGSIVVVDVLSSILSILGTYYLANKYIQAWIVWMGVNILLLGGFLYQGLYIVSVLEVVLFIISLKAYISWKRDLKTVFA